MDKRFTIAPVAVSYGADAEFCDLEGLPHASGLNVRWPTTFQRRLNQERLAEKKRQGEG